MIRVLTITGLVALCAGQVGAQLQYDLYYGLPGETGSRTVDVGIATSKIDKIGDQGDVAAMGKYSVNDQLELGVRATFGFLHDPPEKGFRDEALSAVVAGGKWGLGDMSAITANALIPVGDVDDLGISVGYMMTKEMGEIGINNQLQVGLLDGYTGGVGDVVIDLLIEPTKDFGNGIVGYLDLLVATNNDNIGDNLAINLGPNIDYTVNDMATINAGVTFGIAGDAKQDDVGLIVTAILGL